MDPAEERSGSREHRRPSSGVRAEEVRMRTTYVGSDGRIIPRSDGNALLIDAYNCLRRDNERIQEDLDRAERELFDFRRSRSPTLLSMTDAESVRIQQIEAQNTELLAQVRATEAQEPHVATAVRDVRHGLCHAASTLFRDASVKHGVEPLSAADEPRNLHEEVQKLVQVKDNMLMMLTTVANQLEGALREHRDKAEGAEGETRRVREELERLKREKEQLSLEKEKAEEEKCLLRRERESAAASATAAMAMQERLQQELDRESRRHQHAEERQAVEMEEAHIRQRIISEGLTGNEAQALIVEAAVTETAARRQAPHREEGLRVSVTVPKNVRSHTRSRQLPVRGSGAQNRPLSGTRAGGGSPSRPPRGQGDSPSVVRDDDYGRHARTPLKRQSAATPGVVRRGSGGFTGDAYTRSASGQGSFQQPPDRHQPSPARGVGQRRVDQSRRRTHGFGSRGTGARRSVTSSAAVPVRQSRGRLASTLA
eukprot:TRINITY_DN13380_c0_g1_i1.p1 TRINITY_DN13380_c0_g1~~TRINITY_DN13380_c0_g1_i1.p1  ORF type:complete len:506 (+),score=144.17 TRINITY_DN13380_c0_g1_i1:70-1518(+)